MARWVRLDIQWSASTWLSVLSAESRLAWIELLCHTKAYGTAGRVKAITADKFARMYEMGEESVRKMLKAAENDGALSVLDGDWLLNGWMKYQGDETAPNRMKRYRENRQSGSKPDSVTDVTRNARNVTDVTVTMTETVTETETSKRNTSCFKKPLVSEVGSYFQEIGLDESPQKFLDYYESKGWIVGRTKMKDWRAAARTWKANRKDDPKPKAPRVLTSEELEWVQR